MRRHLLGLAIVPACLALLPAGTPRAAADDKNDKGWVELFNGKDLTGWKTHPRDRAKWGVEDGILVGRGHDAGHLFTVRGDYANIDYVIEAKINDGGNSGQYFRAQFGPSYPKGYEAQINSTFRGDPVKTGSLYPAFNPRLTPAERKQIIVTDMLVKPDEWFTQEVIADGNHIIIKVNGKTTVDFVDRNNSYTKGHLALQHHGASGGIDTVVQFRKIRVKELPAE
jgi:hypothetical protein